MTRDEILSMAREAGIEVHQRKEIARIGLDALTGCDSTEKLAKFAELAASKERAASIEAQAMAECLDMLRTDLVAAGVVGPDVAPMFLTEAVLSALSKERTARIEAQQRLSDAQELAEKSGLAHRMAVQSAVAEAVAEEREACAVVCETLWNKGTPGHAKDCAQSIRARGTP